MPFGQLREILIGWMVHSPAELNPSRGQIVVVLEILSQRRCGRDGRLAYFVQQLYPRCVRRSEWFRPGNRPSLRVARQLPESAFPRPFHLEVCSWHLVG